MACNGPLFFFGRRQGYVYARCATCKSIQLAPFPSKEELDRAYSESYATSGHYGTDPDAIFEASRPFYEAVLRALSALRSGNAGVLDFGCGWGGMCRYLADAGHDYVGVDYPSPSLEYCRRQGLNVSSDSLDDLKAKGPFSAVLLITVFEHLQNHAETLRMLHRMLEPEGLIVILIPTAGLFGRLAKWTQRIRRADELPAMNTTFCPPWHTAIFSLDGAHLLLTNARFERVSVSPAPSGNSAGLKGLAQRAATFTAAAGFAVFGRRWPLVLNHLLVYRRVD